MGLIAGMAMNQRRQGILEQIERQGACVYQELAERHAVSTMTIRRDIEELAREGLVIKTLGGAQKAGAPAFLFESRLDTRMADNLAAKQAIADLALPLADGRSNLYLDGGTTCWEFAKLLSARREGLTVITNSVLISMEVGRNRRNKAVCLGGDYDPDSLSFSGAACEDAAAKYFVDMAFFSTKGFIPEEGTFESAAGNFRIKQIMARQAKEVALLVDHSKFGQRALRKVLDISQIQVVVTDGLAPEDGLRALREAGHAALVAQTNMEEA